MIDLEKFLLDILQDKIDDEIQLRTGRRNETLEKRIYINNNTGTDKYELYDQTFFKQDTSLIINWNESYTDTVAKAKDIFDIIKNLNKVIYDDNTLIVRCVMATDTPQDIKNNDKIYAQLINFQIQYVIRG